MSDLRNLDRPDTIVIASVKSILSPGGCVSPQEIKSFLTMSRKQSDYRVHNDIPRTGSCNDYVTDVIFPAWLSRDYVLDYCGFVANQAENQLLNDKPIADSSVEPDESNPIDPRVDSYGNRDYGKKPVSVDNSIRAWVDRERSIEDIIRQDTAKFLQRKCGPSFLAMKATSTRLSANSNSYAQVYEAYKETSMDYYNDE